MHPKSIELFELMTKKIANDEPKTIALLHTYPYGPYTDAHAVLCYGSEKAILHMHDCIERVQDLELPDIEDRLHSETFMQRLVECIEEMNERLSAADHYAYAVEIEKNDMTATPSLQ